MAKASKEAKVVPPECRDDCIEAFCLCVEKDKGKKLTGCERSTGKGTTLKRIMQQGLGVNNARFNMMESCAIQKNLDKRSKTISAEKFVDDLLPELAKDQDELNKWAKAMGPLRQSMAQGTATKNAAVVDRLTDTSKYTGSHGQRFDETGKGRGKEGREDCVKNEGYVTGYKKGK